jgi:hypothetical protein
MPRLTPPQEPLACPRASAWGPGQLALNQGRRDGRGIVEGAMAKSRQRRRSSCRFAALGPRVTRNTTKFNHYSPVRCRRRSQCKQAL